MSDQLINDGGPAFPIPYGQVMSESGMGMTLRDWFAGMALQGLLASGHFTEPRDEENGAWMTVHADPYDDVTGEQIHVHRRKFDFPEAAWRCADVMLDARKEGA